MMGLGEDVMWDVRSRAGSLCSVSSSNFFFKWFWEPYDWILYDSASRRPQWSLCGFGDRVGECLLTSVWSRWFVLVGESISCLKDGFRSLC